MKDETKRATIYFDAEIHRRLVMSNWWRTAAWSARGVAALGMIGLAA